MIDQFVEWARENGWKITPESEGEFAWNEFQKIEHENAFEDDDRDAVEQFWRGHLPIMMSVGGGYKYWALRLADGKSVSGYEPMFEETSVAANSLEDFLKKIIDGCISL
ncbi:MAG: hypothetical protein OSJ43_01460 [Oscillospiraceae bacterium]|nr:hypothetical protein [Oscillospiraceae bacterium]